MSRFSVSMLEEAVEDILIGKEFYEGNEAGVGAFFAVSALADITSLGIYAGVDSVHFGYFRLLMKRFPFAVYYRKWVLRCPPDFSRFKECRQFCASGHIGSSFTPQTGMSQSMSMSYVTTTWRNFGFSRRVWPSISDFHRRSCDRSKSW